MRTAEMSAGSVVGRTKVTAWMTRCVFDEVNRPMVFHWDAATQPSDAGPPHVMSVAGCWCWNIASPRSRYVPGRQCTRRRRKGVHAVKTVPLSQVKTALPHC